MNEGKVRAVQVVWRYIDPVDMSYTGSGTNRPMKTSPEEHEVWVVPPLPGRLQHVEVATVLVKAGHVDLPGQVMPQGHLGTIYKVYCMCRYCQAS